MPLLPFDLGDAADTNDAGRWDATVDAAELRLRQANSLLKVKRYEEAEELFKGLLDEKDYVKRANEGLAKLARMFKPED